MRHLGAVLFLFAIATASAPARAETSAFETGPSEVGLDASFPETDALDATDADADDSAVVDDAPDATDDAVADTVPDDTAPDDTAPADTGTVVDTGEVVDSALPDTTTTTAETGEAGPGIVTENPGDPYTASTEGDGCQCHAPRGSGNRTGAMAMMLALLVVFTRRQRRR